MMIKIVSTAVAVLVFVSLSQVTIKQIGRWKNGLELWNYVIEKEPRRVLVAYFHRGNLFAARGQYYEAIEDYNKVIAWNYKEYSKVYISRGLTHLKVGQVEPAIADLKKACDLGDPFGCQALQYVVKNGTLTKDTVEHQRR
jgi:tetratricopeptide (TPR) repeat protein